MNPRHTHQIMPLISTRLKVMYTSTPPVCVPISHICSQKNMGQGLQNRNENNTDVTSTSTLRCCVRK